MLFGLEFTLILDSSSHPWRSSDTRIPRVTVLHMSQKKCCKSKHQQIFWATKLRSWCIKASESFREFVKASGANDSKADQTFSGQTCWHWEQQTATCPGALEQVTSIFQSGTQTSQNPGLPHVERSSCQSHVAATMKSKHCSSTCPELPRNKRPSDKIKCHNTRQKTVLFQKSRSGVGAKRSKQSASPKPCSPKLPRTYSYGMLLSSAGFIQHPKANSIEHTDLLRKAATYGSVWT